MENANATVLLTAERTGAPEQESREVLSGVNVQTSTVYVGKADYEENLSEDAVNVTVGVFFDGTWNNRNNTDSRLEHEKRENNLSFDAGLADRYIEGQNSFENYYSNVARLEPFYEIKNEEKQKQLAIYIEGIGTEDFEKDTTFGGGFGTGGAGVRAKVVKACEKVVENIGRRNLFEIDLLVLDTYGFSRGAAAARNFVHEVTQKEGDVKQIIQGNPRTPPRIIRYDVDSGALGEALAEEGIEAKMIVVRFVGLYDTVASYGLIHSNDTRQLNLDAIKKSRNTFQLAAADEHRVNFSLTNIASAGGKGVEKVLPGVHSDIGGGYEDNADEERFLNRNASISNLEQDRQFLIEQGWYLPEEIRINNFWGNLNGNRTGISSRYGDIPLHIMAEYSIAKKVAMEMSKLSRKHPVTGELSGVKSRLDAYVKGELGPMSFENEQDRETLRWLRNRYLHFSAYYSNWLPGPTSVMRPNWENGQRQRVIHNG
ncbi:T6SS phospholipase effector Tle1-like catalytic domain-containing protein [Sinomicrobium sp. M5D2P17]